MIDQRHFLLQVDTDGVKGLTNALRIIGSMLNIIGSGTVLQLLTVFNQIVGAEVGGTALDGVGDLADLRHIIAVDCTVEILQINQHILLKGLNQ